MKKPILLVTIYDDGSTKTEKLDTPVVELDIPKQDLVCLQDISYTIEGSSQRLKQIVLTTSLIIKNSKNISLDTLGMTNLYNNAIDTVASFLGVDISTIRDKFERQMGLTSSEIFELLLEFFNSPTDDLHSTTFIQTLKKYASSNKRYNLDLQAIDTLIEFKKQS